jgi:hypothetical protein
MPHQLLAVFRLLIVVGLLSIIIVVIRDTSGTDAKSSQLSMSQRGIWVGDGLEDRYVGELKEQLMPLIVDDLLVAPNNLKVLFHHIHALICAPAHSEYGFEHLQETKVGAGGGGDTTVAGSARMSHSWTRRASMMSPWILGHCGAKRLMCDILIELLMCHHLNHALNIRCKST